MNADSIFIMAAITLFGIFGCRSGGAQPVNSTQYGNFSIERSIFTEKGEGTVQGKAYETRSYLVRYKVLHKGHPIRFPAALQRGTAYNFPWRVFVLNDAPTLLAGSQNVFLITEKNERPEVIQLNTHRSDYSSLQWLDSESEQPGKEIQILDPQNDIVIDSPLVLAGGKHLLVNHFTVLDVQSTRLYRFNNKNLREYDGWRFVLDKGAGERVAVAFSRKWNQVVFPGLKLDPAIEGNYFPALISFDYVKDNITVIPFNRTKTRLASLDDVDPYWVARNFEWNDGGNLAVRKNVTQPPWQGKINFPSESYMNYQLYPVKESMMDEFEKFLKQTLKQNNPPNAFAVHDESVTGSTQRVFRIVYDKNIFQLGYDRTGKKLIFERHFNEPDSEQYHQLILELGNRFNKELEAGNHETHFDTFEKQ